MKINKFKVFAYLGLGLAAISTAGTYAGYASLAVEVDPRINLAAQVADYSGKALDAYGNYLWKQEVEAESDKIARVEFENKNDFEVVKSTSLDDFFLQLDDY